MDAKNPKRVLVGGFDYIIDENAGVDAVTIVNAITAALNHGTVTAVPVRDDKNNELTLYINGGQVEALVIDPGDDTRPGQFAP